MFYSAPFFWFGGAYLLYWLQNLLAFLFLSRFEDSRQIVSTLASSVACSILLVFVWIKGPVNQLAKPSIPVPIIKAMAELKFIAGQEKSVLASWWDYGYASMLMNGIPTFTDPGSTFKVILIILLLMLCYQIIKLFSRYTYVFWHVAAC